MLYIMLPNETLAITGWNMHMQKNGMYQIWVTKVDGRTQKITENIDLEEAEIMIEALNYSADNKKNFSMR